MPVLSQSPISSPCINICELNSAGLCSGCFRTANEIGLWVTLDELERKKIMQVLPQRKEQYLLTLFD